MSARKTKAHLAYLAKRRCQRHVRHPTEDLAELAIVRMSHTKRLGPHIRSWPCDVCQGWHVGRATERDRRKRLRSLLYGG